jgi:hypothetical protein
MATSYTTNFSFPLLETGSDGWMATINGMLVDMDIELYKAQHPIVNRSGEIMVSLTNGMVMKKMFSTTGA